MGHFVKAILLLCMAAPLCVAAQVVDLATGEYPPFVGQKEPEQGVLSAIVAAALETQGLTAKLTFLPWKRASAETLQGNFAATFPYTKNQERMNAFYFSRSLYTDTIRMFALASTPHDAGWDNKSVCIPLGYNSESAQAFAKSKNARLERPPEMINCFEMLKRGHVQGVWASEIVAASHRPVLGPSMEPIRAMEIGIAYPIVYFLMVPKSLPDASGWLARFNAGLQEIQKNGVYARITQRLPPQYARKDTGKPLPLTK
jgi:polar amino acid transport system substrate-binding protein